MNRQNLPLPSAAPDLSVRMTEIRMPARSERHDARHREEARP